MIINSYRFAVSGLTDYPSGVDFAVSVREILGYTGAIWKIRRASDNAELTFYQGATEYSWNTTRGGGGTDLYTWIGSSSGFVVEWYRQDGSGGKLYNYSSANQPRIINAGTADTSGGFQSVFFQSSSSYYMFIDGTGLPSNLVPHTSMYAGNRTTSAKYGLLLTRDGSIQGLGISRWNDNKVYQRTTDGQDAANSTNNTTSFEIFAAYATSTTHSMDTHLGNIASTHTETAYSTVDFNAYGRYNSAGAYSDFKVVEHVYWNGEALSNYSDTITFMKGEFGL